MSELNSFVVGQAVQWEGPIPEVYNTQNDKIVCCAGQLAVLGRSPSAPLIQEMLEHEEAHLARFQQLLVEHSVRPTVLVPLWRLAGFTLGAGSALLGNRVA